MIKMSYRYIIPILMLLLSATYGYSQTVNCATSIIEAEDMYRAGKYDDAIQLLQTALKGCSFSKREKEDAYLILTQAFLEKENYREANHLLVKILNNDPNFKLKENLYQEDFYAYYNKIKIRPMFSAGLKLGINFPRYSIKHVNKVYNSANDSLAYKPETGYMYGIFAEWQFYDNIAIAAEGCFSQMGYKRIIQVPPYKLPGSDSLMLNYSEVMKSLETSLYIKKYFLHKQFRPFVYLGGYLSSLNSATANINLSYTSKDPIAGGSDHYNLSDSTNVLTMRNKIRQGVVSGIGISYKTKNVLISANAGYRMDIGKHLTNSDNKYKNEKLLYKFYYIDNDVTLSRLDLSLTVAYIIKYSVKSK